MWFRAYFIWEIFDGRVPDINSAFINFLTRPETYLTIAMSLLYVESS